MSSSVSAGGLMRELRLWSGAVLAFYIFSHFINHMAGLVSLRAMEEGALLFTAAWRSWPGTVILLGALTVHLACVLLAVYRRRSLRMSQLEWTQLLLGLLIIPLGAFHVVGTRMAHEMVDMNTSYALLLFAHWQTGFLYIGKQLGLTLAVWIHACIGFHQLWRLKPAYPAWRPYLFSVALLIPVLALLAYYQRGEEVWALMQDQDRRGAFLRAANLPGGEARALLERNRWIIEFGFAGLLLSVLGGRLARDHWRRRKGTVNLRYPSECKAAGAAGPSILEFSRMANIAHASVCGGRGRCSTCRVRISEASTALPAPSPEEAKVLARVGAPENVRLACQLRPLPGNYAITPLLPANANAADGFRKPAHHHGQERNLTILFADLRGFTTLAEHRLPYDTVFLLNRYFRSMGEAIEEAGGRLDKFIGDGVMALFGIDTDPATAARQAIDAARRMGLALRALNESLRGDVPAPLRIGIGLHAGLTIVGEMGHGHARSLTAIGDVVNTASRLEGLSKELHCQLVVSQDVLDLAQTALGAWPEHDVAVRGRQMAMKVTAVADAADLTVMIRA